MMWHEVTGEGPPVLLLHAGIADARMWDREWTAWAESFRLVRCDLPGFGRTPALRGGAERPAAEAAALLDDLGLRSVAVVGASYGGAVALELTVGRPDLVSRVLLAAGGLPGRDWSEGVRAGGVAEEAAISRGDLNAAVEATLATWLAGPTRGLADVDPALVDVVRAMQRRALELQVPVMEEFHEERLAPGFQHRLHEIAVPVLAVTTELDQPDFALIAGEIVAVVSGARHVVIEGAAHLPNLEQPAAFDAVALPFLSGQ